MDLKGRLQAALTQQAAEVERLRLVAENELPSARIRLAQLEALLAKWTPDIEDGYTMLKAVGIRLDD